MGIYADRGYTVQQAKDACIAEIESWYGGATLDTFDCNVLGAVHRYECNEAAQLRFLHGKTSNLPITLMSGPVLAPDVDPIWNWVSHTATECGKVHGAYLEFIKQSALDYANFKTQLAAATTVAEVEAVFNAVWPQ